VTKKEKKKDNTLYPIREPTNKTKKFATIDVEAQSWIEYVVGGIFDGKEYYQTKYVDQLLTRCFKIAKERNITDFFAHFGGKYDFLFFLKESIINQQFTIKNIIPRGSGILQFDLEMNCDFCLANDLDYYQDMITFRDSSALLPFSLESACESFKVENVKTYFDYNFVKHSYDNIDYFKDIYLNEDYEIYHHGITISKWEWITYETITTHSDVLNPINYMDGWDYFHGNELIKSKKEGSIAEVIIVDENFSGDIVIERRRRDHVIKVIPKDYRKENITYKIYSDKKAEFMHKIYNRKDLLGYLDMDLKALHECLTKFYNWDLVKYVGPSTTVAGQALKVLRKFLKKPLFSIVNPNESRSHLDEFCRKGYFGGRTEIFRPLYQDKKGDKTLFCFDVNSLYPTEMFRNTFPNKFKGWRFTKEDFDKEEFGYWSCDVEVPKDTYFPVLGVEHKDEENNKKFIFPTGKFSGVWPSVELKYALSQGTKITKIHRGAVFETGDDFFKEFVDVLYNMRLKAKEEGDAVGDIMCKLLLNSCYGKFGVDVFDKENLVLCEDGEFDVQYEIPLGNDIFACLTTVSVKLEKTFNNVAVAGWVTALARVHLHKLFIQAGEKFVFNCDTDSVFTTKKLKTGSGLGALKLEYASEEAVFLLPKTYYIGEGEKEGRNGMENFMKKVVMKGFDKKKIQGFEFSDFSAALEGDLRKLKITEMPKVATFKTAIRYGELLMMKNDPATLKNIHERKEREYLARTGKKKRYVKDEYKLSERAIKSSYNKRIIIKEGWDTRPIHI